MTTPTGMWGGRFEESAHPLFRAFNDSLAFDYRLATQDLLASIAWADAIRGAGVVTTDECSTLTRAMSDLLAEVRANPRAPLGESASTGAPPTSIDEDVHSWIERRLVERLGSLGKKLHTGRSRNDEVATALRLWVRDEIDARLSEMRALRASLLALATRELDTPMPGYTHLQRAQPIVWGHWSLAYEQMLARDADRLRDARRRVNVCPLGSGALAGTTYPVDRRAIAASLGFDSITANSLDAVSDRDFVVESLGALALVAVHLSRLAEDLIIYSTGEFALVSMSDRVTSGSSLMPQKKNPDACELLRAKAGRIIAAHAGLCTVIKGLPLAYNKDLQEDKEPIFDAMEQSSLCLRVACVVIDGLRVDRSACRAGAAGGYSNATELADYLVSKGLPFREAHDITGRVVREAIALHVPLDRMSPDAMRAIEPRIGPDVLAGLTIEACLTRRDIPGGTAITRVTAALSDAQRTLAAEFAVPPHSRA